jgi:Spy/CpxP family protein refolding chaperone
MRKLFKKGGFVFVAAGLFVGLGLSASADENTLKDGEGNTQLSEDHAWDKGGWEDTCNKKCDLTSDQKTKLKSIFKKQRESTQPLVDQIKVDMATLQQKVDAKAGDEDIKTILVNLDDEKNKLANVRDSFEDKLDNLLTPTQEAKFLLAKTGHNKWENKDQEKRTGELTKGDDTSENSNSGAAK